MHTAAFGFKRPVALLGSLTLFGSLVLFGGLLTGCGMEHSTLPATTSTLKRPGLWGNALGCGHADPPW